MVLSVRARRSRAEDTDRSPAIDKRSCAQPPIPTAPAPKDERKLACPPFCSKFGGTRVKHDRRSGGVGRGCAARLGGAEPPAPARPGSRSPLTRGASTAGTRARATSQARRTVAPERAGGAKTGWGEATQMRASRSWWHRQVVPTPMKRPARPEHRERRP
jgi:hypothetical protein